MDNPFELTYKTPTKPNFVDTTDFEQAELLDIIKLSRAVREHIDAGKHLHTLYHQVSAVIKERPAKTVSSIETAMAQLGGYATDVTPGIVQLGFREPIADTAMELSQVFNMINARVNRHESILELADKSEIPVINGGSDYNNPTGELGDMLTILDHLPDGKDRNKVKVVFVGDCTEVCVSLMMITTKMGMNFIQYAPPAKWLGENYLNIGRANTQRYGGSVHVTDNPVYLDGADFVYTDVWYKYCPENAPKEVYLREFYPKYQVNDELLSLTHNSQVKIMHCLPVTRGEEISDSVVNSANSLIKEQVKNYLAAERGLCLYFGGVAEAAMAGMNDPKGEQDAKD